MPWRVDSLVEKHKYLYERPAYIAGLFISLYWLFACEKSLTQLIFVIDLCPLLEYNRHKDTNENNYH